MVLELQHKTAMPPPVIIFGATGFIGGRIAEHLGRAGFAVDRHGSASCNLLDAHAVFETMAKAATDSIVIHCSAIGRRQEDSLPALEKNLRMTDNLARACKAAPPKSLIFLSSADIYGAQPQELPLRENTPPRPDTYYGTSKLAAEHLYAMHLRDVCPVVVLRLPGVFGRADKLTSIVGLFLARTLRREPIEIHGDGATQRDYVDAHDLCRIVETFLQNSRHGVFNAVTGASCTLNELLAAIARAANMPQTIVHREKSDRSADLIFDNSRLLSALPDAFSFRTLQQSLAPYLKYVAAIL